MKPVTQHLVVASLLAVGLLTAAEPAAAQGFISPLVGFNFGGDAGCQTATDCNDKNLNLGVSFGSLGTIFGFEEEVAYARDFFGETPGLSSNVLTVMSNLMLAPDLKVVRPYALAGVGLIKSHAELTGSNLLSTDNNAFGWNVGGGLMVFLTPNVGLRGDIRYFHAFQDLELGGLTISDTKLDFGRAAAALVFKF
ncbi:MAG: outer membrane beta-barrel protein [Vicinamibacterales bacterium]